MRVLTSLMLCLLFVNQQTAQAQEKFPARELTYLITFDAGGQSDREAKRHQPLLAKALGQNVTIEYKVGAGGALGWKELARAKPDGYMFAGVNLPHIILQPLQQPVGYKTEQIVPVAIFQSTPLGLAVPKDSPYKTVKELLDAAAKDPEKITLGGAAVFSGHHLAALRLQKLSGAKFAYVPYSGSAPQMTAFLGGQLGAVFANSDDLLRNKDKLRVLAFSAPQRFPAFPDAPTLKESGFDMADSIDRGVAVPQGTPPEVIATLEKAFLEIARNPEIQAAMKAEGFVPLAMGHEESVKHVQKLTAVYEALAKDIK